MGLIQALITVMIENHRTGLIWTLLMSSADDVRLVSDVVFRFLPKSTAQTNHHTEKQDMLLLLDAKAKGALASILVLHFVVYLWTFQWKQSIFFGMSKGKSADPQVSEVLQGTLDLMMLKVLDALGSLHGYGIARRIEQVSEQVLQLNEGTVYTSLLRLQQRGWIASDWEHRRTIARLSTIRSPKAAENSSRARHRIGSGSLVSSAAC
jgi:Transcriptional regulator PadR-like family